MTERPKSSIRRIMKVIGCIILAIVIATAVFFGVLTVTEYKPKDSEKAVVDTAVEMPESGEGQELTVMTWNMGYAALGESADFFMDGGSMVKTAAKEEVYDNLKAVAAVIKDVNADVVFLQELDRKSSRSYKIDQEKELVNDINGTLGGRYITAFAYNYKTLFVPYPLPPIGKVESGILTLSGLGFSEYERLQLPCPFSWPVRLANLKRCLLVTRTPVYDNAGKDTGKEIVFVNLHLEAFDSGEGKIAQTEMLKQVLTAEAEKGNYVIAGGDFNQTFSSVDDSMYPEYPDTWHCGEIDVSMFSGFDFLMDNSVPTGRSLDRPYAGADRDDFQYYMIDGFIVSDNVTVNSCETLDLGFVNSDHNPVVMSVTLD